MTKEKYIQKLKVEDVQGTHIIIIEQKTKKPKRSFINDLFKRDLTEYIESEGLGGGDYLVYSNKKDENGEQRPISRVQAYKILKSVGNKVGISSIGTHTLRKTFGYHHYQQYKDVAVLQNIFNHSSPATTLRYIGINDDIMDKTIEQFYI